MESRTTRTVRPPTQTYRVPERFGAGGMLAMMLVFSVVFGVLHRMNAGGWYYVFFGLLGLVVGVVQMRGGRNPRTASILAGAVLLPPSTFLAVASRFGPVDAFFYLPAYVLAAVLGAGVGYMMGTLLGGAFLVADYLERYFDPRLSNARAESEPIVAIVVDDLPHSERRYCGDLSRRTERPAGGPLAATPPRRSS